MYKTKGLYIKYVGGGMEGGGGWGVGGRGGEFCGGHEIF